MSCESESKTIGDRKFTVTQWDAEKCLLMKIRLLRTLGPASQKILTSIDSDGEVEGLLDGFNEIFQGNDPQEVVAMLKDVVMGASCSSVEGDRITDSNFNLIFDANNLTDIYVLFIFVLKVNYYKAFTQGHYSKKIVARVKKMMAKAAGDNIPQEEESKLTEEGTQT